MFQRNLLLPSSEPKNAVIRFLWNENKFLLEPHGITSKKTIFFKSAVVVQILLQTKAGMNEACDLPFRHCTSHSQSQCLCKGKESGQLPVSKELVDTVHHVL